MRKLQLLLLIIILTFISSTISFSFGPSTHIYISSNQGNKNYFPIGDYPWYLYFFNTLGPDSTIGQFTTIATEKEVYPVDWAHSPVPKFVPEADRLREEEKWLFYNSHNFGYLMWILAPDKQNINPVALKFRHAQIGGHNTK